MQRVLSVSLSHAIRGAALVLLPFAFIALVAWATAGSATGTTTDPIRGAAWIWLGSHHIPQIAWLREPFAHRSTKAQNPRRCGKPSHS